MNVRKIISLKNKEKDSYAGFIKLFSDYDIKLESIENLDHYDMGIDEEIVELAELNNFKDFKYIYDNYNICRDIINKSIIMSLNNDINSKIVKYLFKDKCNIKEFYVTKANPADLKLENFDTVCTIKTIKILMNYGITKKQLKDYRLMAKVIEEVENEHSQEIYDLLIINFTPAELYDTLMWSIFWGSSAINSIGGSIFKQVSKFIKRE